MTGSVCRIDQRTFRLISTAHHKPPVLEPLASSFGARSILEQLESVTSGRQIAQQVGVPGIAPSALGAGYGYTYVNAAFAYPRPDGNRFNPREWGAWYAAFEAKTSLAEVAFHLTRALERSGGEYDNISHYVELIADFACDFHDLRHVSPAPECLHPDTSIGYPHGQTLAAALRQSGSNGIVYPSVRDIGGTCLVAFWPGLVQNFQRGETWVLTWAGSPTPEISKVSA